MTLDRLNTHVRLLRKLEELRNLRDSLRTAAEPGAQRITGMPHAPGYRDRLGDLAAEIADVSGEIEALAPEVELRGAEIAVFINTIRDSYARTVFRLRFLRGLDWGETAAVLGGGNTAASVRSACYRWLKVVSPRSS